jgi:hypothetical protein
VAAHDVEDLKEDGVSNAKKKRGKKKKRDTVAAHDVEDFEADGVSIAATSRYEIDAQAIRLQHVRNTLATQHLSNT